MTSAGRPDIRPDGRSRTDAAPREGITRDPDDVVSRRDPCGGGAFARRVAERGAQPPGSPEGAGDVAPDPGGRRSPIRASASAAVSGVTGPWTTERMTPPSSRK